LLGSDELELEVMIRQAMDGNKESFAVIIKHFELSLYKVAKSMLESEEDCADAIQETILKAYKSIRNLRETQFFKTWLIRILINECNNIYKIKGKVIPICEIEKTASEVSIINDVDNTIVIQEMLNHLQNELRTIVILYYFEDFSVKDISDLLSVPEGTVKSRLSRARNKLKNAFNISFIGSDCCEQ
jgi:RNA polymerase sigma-70 factor (ECF subfamily)